MIYKSGGKILVSGGKLRGCCCGDQCSICTLQEVATPVQADITISDVVVCNGCYAGLSNSRKYENIVDISGTYRVTQDADEACLWIYTEEGSYGTVRQYSDTLCTSQTGVWVLDRLFIHLYRYIYLSRFFVYVFAMDSNQMVWPYDYRGYWIQDESASPPDADTCIGKAQKIIAHSCLLPRYLTDSIKYAIAEV